MASGFFAVLDDISALMDDVAVTAKVAAGKTAGILGDDLAVNAEKATGFVSSRELPVLWAITKGSLINKLILVPLALLLNLFLPSAIRIALVAGGLYLAYEGVEKIWEFLIHFSPGSRNAKKGDAGDEKSKIRSAIRTDFILSIEIVIIALGAVPNKSMLVQAVTVAVIAIVATIGVYGIVALIVRMDDAGYRLINLANHKRFLTIVGHFLVQSLPVIIKLLGIVGTFALILVSGGIFMHHIGFLHFLLPDLHEIIREFLVGLVAGALIVIFVNGAKKLWTLRSS